MIQKILDFFETELGKRIGMSALGVLVVVVTVSTYLITDAQDKKEEKEAAVVVATNKTNETKVKTETKESELETTDETTTAETTTLMVEQETTEEITIDTEVIPIEDLNVSEGDKLGEDAVPQKKPNVVVEKDTETTTREDEDVETEDYVKPVDNHILSAPSPSANEYACMVHGIDVSKWNGDINWSKVKAAGYNFVFIRCGYRGYESGTLATDDKFKENIEGAKAAGLQVGVYFFSQAINEKEAREEASLVISMIKDYNITYPVVFDWETDVGYRTYSGISVDKMTRIVNTFLTIVENEGYEAMVYGNKYDLQRFDYVSVSKNYKIWHARYPEKYQDHDKYYVAGEAVPELECSYQIWQYKSTGKVDGIDGEVDMNVAFFSYAGSGVQNTTLKINAPSDTIVTNIGVPVEDFYKDVTAANSAGIDATKSVTHLIYDENGGLADESSIYDVAGTYEVAYYIKDFTGIPFKKSIKLIVRGNPTISLKYTNLMWFDSTDATGVLEEDMLVAFKENIQKLVEENVEAAVDYDGDDIMADVTIDKYVLDDVVASDEYLFKFMVTDDTGLTGEASMTLNKVSLLKSEVEVKVSELVGETVSEGLNTYLLDNISVENPQGIDIVFDEALLKDIEDGTVNTGNEYEIKYVMTGMDVEKFYKICTLVIVEGMIETTTESTTEIQSETSSETTAADEITGE